MGTEVKMSTIPDCDLCKDKGLNVKAVYDGKTTFGPWAYMCQAHWDAVGPSQLGTGYGQKLIQA